jgi:phage shock protein PspC (stress-responsive transcriptional regulator)
MTETADTPPTDSTTTAPPSTSFVRPREGRIVAGVCAGIAQKWNLDLTLVRVVAVVTALFSGVGLAVYAAMWLLTPSVDGPAPLASDSPTAQRVQRTGDRLARRLPAIILIVLGVVVIGHLANAMWWGWGPPVGLILVALLVAVFVGTRRGRWALVAFAAVVALAIGSVAAFGTHFGTRTYHVSSVDELRSHYEYGAGKVNLDLSQIEAFQGGHRTEIRLGRGNVVVTVPDDLPVFVHARAGVGSVTVDGHEVSGFDAEQSQALGGTTDSSSDRLYVDVAVGAGAVDIRSE